MLNLPHLRVVKLEGVVVERYLIGGRREGGEREVKKGGGLRGDGGVILEIGDDVIVSVL